MQLPKLQSAILLQRYKRFLADIKLSNHNETTIHCANTGAMTGCADAGDKIWFSTSDNPKRKYPHSWELTEKSNGDLICINTLRANQIVHDALQERSLPPFHDYTTVHAEVKYGEENSRIDFLLQQDNLPDCYIEVKSVTLLGDDHIGMFPDAKTTRGQKHLRELMAIHQQGKRAVILFAVLHSGIDNFRPATEIDQKYAELLKEAVNQGVEIYCYKAAFAQEQGIPVEMRLLSQQLEMDI